jgi:type I restriction enzyme R subunit
MSNFRFLKTEWPELYQESFRAEQRAVIEPISSLSYARRVLERVVQEVYAIERLELPYDTRLSNLVQERDFQRVLPHEFESGIKIIRLNGNNAAHPGKRVTADKAIVALKYLYSLARWFVVRYSADDPELPARFNEALIPKEGPSRAANQQLKEAIKLGLGLEEQVREMQRRNAELEARMAASEEVRVQALAEIASQRQQIEARAAERSVPVGLEFNEAETRTHLIDATLTEAGWQPGNRATGGYEAEAKVIGMPLATNPKGNGYVDYVLWDDDGLPLALIEAKRTSKKTGEAARHQAQLYAGCLEEMYGRRPLIYLSNGYTTLLWDDAFYSAARRVYGFLTRAEMRTAIARRSLRKDLSGSKPNDAIVNRGYQHQAIQRVAEALMKEGRGNRREVLLVMATGSGKTRTAAALVELLFTHGWVNRVLFLADRNALVKQAKNSFTEHLPAYTSINLTQEKDEGQRLVFSTYPTMLNRIDAGEYGVGTFDLVICDEAHRSVYNRYRAIFQFFDSLVLGLTATPKESIDHNTYGLFGCSDGDPTFEYPLEAAIPVYLKGYRNLDVSTDFMREGIKYAELSEREKIRYEEEFRDETTGAFPDEIAASAMNKNLFNKDTAFKVLDALMTSGQKIEGGDSLGRTIVFAVSKLHADFLFTCFQERYPELPPDFVAVVHHGVSHAQDLIDKFCDKFEERMPRVVISVDMMDTGVDAPRVLNLVFFKVVRSYAKFWQMIGRGTRLCPDAFGPGLPKEHFLVFDVCQNFEFFAVNQLGADAGAVKGVTEQCFGARLQLSQLLLASAEDDDHDLAVELLNDLHAQVVELKNPDQARRFRVKMQTEHIDVFQDRNRWAKLSNDDIRLLRDQLGSVIPAEEIHESARRFDLLVLKLRIARLLALSRDGEKLEARLIGIADGLSDIQNIPAIDKQAELIADLRRPEYYPTLGQVDLDHVSTAIRDLLVYLTKEQQTPAYTNFADSDVSGMTTAEPVPVASPAYRRRVEAFLRKNAQHVTIRKLRGNTPITPAELQSLEEMLFDGGDRGTRDDFRTAFGDQPLSIFVRSILGMEEAAARAAFADFLRAGPLTADQMTFIDNIVTYLTQNGRIEPSSLFQAPFNRKHDMGLAGVFSEGQSERIISIVRALDQGVG